MPCKRRERSDSCCTGSGEDTHHAHTPRTRTRTRTHTHTHARTHTLTHARTHSRTHTHARTHARTHSHKHTPIFSASRKDSKWPQQRKPCKLQWPPRRAERFGLVSEFCGWLSLCFLIRSLSAVFFQNTMSCTSFNGRGWRHKLVSGGI